MPLHIAEGRESTVTFTVHVKDDLGAAQPRLSRLRPGRGNDATRDLERAPAGPVYDAGEQRKFHQRQRASAD